MPDFIPYSEKQQILPVDVWEGCNILNLECATTKVTAQTLRPIVSRLLQIDKSGRFNANDFDFLVYDDPRPNAGFISANKTKNNRNVIIISTGISGLCKTEEELAGILAHELGHYTYYQLYGANENTVFQERFSDLHALDLMIAGGYDPSAYSRVCETMHKMGGAPDAVRVLLDEHGSGTARKEDVDAYLTKLHIERGDFKVSAPTGLYGNLITVLNNHPDNYKTYWQQLLENKFPEIIKNPEYKPPINSVFDLILSELKNGRLNNPQRIKNMWQYLVNYGAIEKPEIESTQNFIEQLIDFYHKDTNVNELLKYQNFSFLCNTFIKNFRGGKVFDVFAPIDQTLAQINEFMTTRDPERVKELTDILDNNAVDVFYMSTLKSVFGQPQGFKMPLANNAKGQMVPTDWLLNAVRKIGFSTYLRALDIIKRIGFDCDYKWMTDGRFDDEYTGKIIAVGKEEINKVRDERWAKENYKRQQDNFSDFMYAIGLLYDFDLGKISASEVVNRFYQYGKNREKEKKVLYDIDSFIYWLHTQIELTDYRKTNPFLGLELQELNNSAAFAEFYIKPFLLMLKKTVRRKDPKSADKIHTDNPPAGKTWFKYLQEISSKYLGLKEDVSFDFKDGEIQLNGKLLDVLRNFNRKIGVQYKDSTIWNVNMGPVIEHISGVQTEKLHSVLMKFINTAVEEHAYSSQEAANILYIILKNGDYSGQFKGVSENKTADLIAEQEKQNREILQADTIENYSVYASKEQWSEHNLWPILDALNLEIKHNTDLHKVYRVLSAYGMLANNEQELLNTLSKPTPRLKTDSKTLLETRLKEAVLIYYMRNNKPITNIYPLLVATLGDKTLEFSNDFADELEDYMEANNLIPEDFQSLYNLHAVMQKLDLFSKEKSGHVKMLDLLVKKIEKMPVPINEIYSWNLLSGFYYDDNSGMRFLNRKSDDMDLPLIKNKLLDIFSDAVAERLGQDNDSYEYFAKIQELSEFINQEHLYDMHEYYKRVGINKVTKGKLYRLISDKIQSQERVSKFLANDKNVVLSDANAQSKDLLGRGTEALLEQLEREADLCIYSIEFLNRKLTAKSISEYRTKCAVYSGYIEVEKFIKPSVLENLYHTFWSSGLEVRAIIMNKLLNRAFDTLDKKIKYVCDMNFDKDNKYRKDAEMICDCVIKSFQPYEQDLILAAIASADENKQEGQSASRSVGEGLRMFFENMGPAWVKFGQLLSYVPDLPSEIRRDLAKLKDRADMPARWDVYTWMHEAMPQDLYNRIERVDDIVGAGSFWMTAIVQLRNDKGKPEKKVVQLLRPNADARADSGFKTIELAIKKLAKRNSSYQILQEVAHQAHESAKYEVDVEIGNKQYEKAKELYGDINVNIDGTQYTPHVADWRYYGTGKNGMSYKIMDYAEGATLSRVYASDDERRKMALAYFTIEMVNLFKGDVWDIDRHQGQQNFDIVSPKNVNINIYDTGAQLPKAPDRKNKILLANIFFDLVQEVQSGKSIDSYLLKTIKRLDKLQNTLHIDVSYVSNIQKGLMALSDIIEYQKEIKDADGNIIQKRLTLSAEDLKHAIVAVLQNPSVDEHMGVVIKGRVVAAKLKHMDIQGLKELLNNTSVAQDNPVEITIADREHESQSSKFNKASEEIADLDNPDDYIMGIPKKHVEQQSAKPPLIFDPYQKAA